jgi:hypothetical protein
MDYYGVPFQSMDDNPYITNLYTMPYATQYATQYPTQAYAVAPPSFYQYPPPVEDSTSPPGGDGTTGTSTKAMNMMKKMGFVEGKGLGKDLQGVSESIGKCMNFIVQCTFSHLLFYLP